MIKQKLLASGIHLGISSIIFLILSYFIIFEWYPFPYFTADGGWQGIRIIALIDLVLGPFLTLIVFNPAKPKREIRSDLGIIAFVQVCSLIWGTYTVHNERPVAVVHWDGEFFTIPAKTFTALNISLKELNQFSQTKPALIHAYHPDDPIKLQEILNITTQQMLAPIEQFQLYRSFKENKDDVFAYKINIQEIITHNRTMKDELDTFLTQSGGRINDYVYMPLNARYHNVILIFSETGNVMGTLNAPYKNEIRKF